MWYTCCTMASHTSRRLLALAMLSLLSAFHGRLFARDGQAQVTERQQYEERIAALESRIARLEKIVAKLSDANANAATTVANASVSNPVSMEAPAGAPQPVALVGLAWNFIISRIGSGSWQNRG